MTEERYHTLGEVAEVLQVSQRTVHRWITSGALPAFKPGGDWRIGDSDLQTFLESRRTATAKKAQAPSPEVEQGRRLRDLRSLRDVYELLAQAWERHPPDTSADTSQLTDAIAGLVEQGVFEMPDEMSGDDYAEFIFLKLAFQRLNEIADSVEKDEKRHQLLRVIEGNMSA